MSEGKRETLGWGILELAIFSALINMLLLAAPLYLLQVYDRVLPSSSSDTLIYLTIAAVAALVVLGVLDVIRSQYANRISNRIATDSGEAAFVASVTSGQTSSGDVQPLRDLMTLRGFLSSRALFSLFDLPFSPLFIAILYLLHPTLFYVTAGGAAVLLVVAIVNQAATARSATSSAAKTGKAMAVAQSFARDFEAIRALGMTRAVTDAWGARFAQSLTASDRFARTNAFYSGLSRSLRMLLQIAILGVGAYLVLNNEMTAGMIFAASIISSRALQPLDQIIGSWRQITDAAHAWRRVRAISASKSSNHGNTTKLPTPRGNIAAEQLVYYSPNPAPGSPPLIKRVSFEIAAGEALALIGPSGSGKSTLARLLVGAIHPYSGTVRLDSADITQWNPEKLGIHLGYLPQQVELLPGTVARNIARFDPNADDEDIMAAARQAQAHELILQLKNGYDTEIGPDGVELSGGERQRIGLARALFRKPVILVLDEPTNNLDADGEAALGKSLSQARAYGAAVLVITHKPDIAATCDQVLLLRDGQVELLGEAKEVLQRLIRAKEDGQAPVVGNFGFAPFAAPGRATASFGQIIRAPVAGSLQKVQEK